MRNINLLPKVPFIAKHIRVLMAGTAGILLAGAAMIVVLAYVLGLRADTKEQEAAQMRLQAAFWQNRHAEDPKLRLFQSYRAAADQLIASRTDWTARIESVMKELPAKARIVELDTDREGMTQLSLNFARMEDAADYLAALSRNEHVAAFDITSMNKRETAAPEPEAGDEQPTSETPAMPRPSETFYQERMAELARAEDENEALLHELEWLFEQAVAQETFGISLPDLRTGGAGGAEWKSALDASDRDAITEEEYASARARWEAYTAQRESLAELDRNRDAVAGPEPAEAEPNARTIDIYEVKIVLSWGFTSGAEGGAER